MAGHTIVQLVALYVLGGMRTDNFGLDMIMAAVTGIGWIGTGVALGAGHFSLVAVVEREAVPSQARGRPGRGRMACDTIGAKQPGMDFGLGMAPHAVFGRSLEDFVNVALFAVQWGMLAIEHKEVLVVEVLHVAGAVVAGRAIEAVLLGMIGHEFTVCARVTGNTDLWVILGGARCRQTQSAGMTLGAREGAPVIILDM